MKSLKFRKNLSELILKGEKTTTWRIFDDKDIQMDDELVLLVWETKKEFAKAKVIAVREVRFKELTKEDLEGHEKFSSDKEMYETYSEYYNQPVTEDTIVKIIKFKLMKEEIK